jgi:hypothetical protein
MSEAKVDSAEVKQLIAITVNNFEKRVEFLSNEVENAKRIIQLHKEKIDKFLCYVSVLNILKIKIDENDSVYDSIFLVDLEKKLCLIIFIMFI